MTDTKELAVIAKENNLPNNKVQELLSQFGDSFQLAKDAVNDAKDIEVTDESQTEKMAIARTARLKLKNIRIDVERTRKDLKEQSLREGKAVDGMANIIKALIIPIEEHLEKQERFAEVKAAERMAKRHTDRVEKLSRYVDDISLYTLDSMSNEAFDNLLSSSKKAFEDQKTAELKAEKDRKAKEEADWKKQERIREENARLKKDAERREIKAAEERRVLEDKRRAERAEAAEKLKAERDKRDGLEREKKQREQDEADRKAKAEEATRQQLLAPDKEKLMNFATVIDALEMPNVSNREAGKLLDETQDFLNRISKNLRSKAKQL